MSAKTALALGAALACAVLIAGCGSPEPAPATNNISSAAGAELNQFTIGNDASAVEMVNSNAAEGPDLLPLGNLGAPDVNGSAGNDAAPAEDGVGNGARERVQANKAGN